MSDGYRFIVVDKGDGFATITLNRPEVLNALNYEMRLELERALDQLDEDNDVRVVVLRGAGRAFCAGAFVKGQEAVRGVDFYSRHVYNQRLFFRIAKFRKPIIAAVHGYCLGLGLEYALQCDIIIASDDAKFGEPEINLGEAYGTVRLPRLIGEKRAKWISMTGELIDAHTAEKWGFITKVVPRDSLDQEVQSTVEKLKEKSPTALWLLKEAIKAGLETDMHTALFIEAITEALTTTTPDYEEGMAAFRGKRKPVFDRNLPRILRENWQ